MQGEDGHVKISLDVGLRPKPHITPKITGDIHGCHVEYYVPECSAGDLCVHRFRNSWKIPFNMEVVAVHNHFHNGAINMTTAIQGGSDICTGYPTYRDGFLVETTKCAVGHGLVQPMRVNRGQHILVETHYQQDARPHFGVMGYAMFYVHRLDIKDPSSALMV